MQQRAKNLTKPLDFWNEDCIDVSRQSVPPKCERGGSVKRLWMSMAVMAAFVALPGIAHADAVYQVGGTFSCPNNSCLGGSYTLTFIGDNSGTTFQVTLTATTPGSGSGSPAFGDYISSVEFGDGKSVASASLSSTTAGGVSSWGNTVFGNLSNGGCTSGPAPMVCNNQTLNNLGQYSLAVANGSTYSWTWNVVFSKPGLDLNEADMHIGLQYSNASNTSQGLIVSESGVSTVPEPSSMLLLGVGLVGLLGLKGRKVITA